MKNNKLFYGLSLLFLLFLLAMILFNCAGSKPAPQKQEIKELAGLEIGTTFSFLDEEGKQTTIKKLDSKNFEVKSEGRAKSKKKGGSFIHVEIHKDKSKVITDSYNKDKSTTTTTTADNGAVIGKDKSDNKMATDSGNKEVSNAFPWYVWILAVLLAAFFLWSKFKP